VAAAERQAELDEAAIERVKAQAAATDNIGLFFGEDVFFAIGSILVIQSTLATYGYDLSPLTLAFWAIPTAIAAFVVHGGRLLWMDRKLGQAPRSPRAKSRDGVTAGGEAPLDFPQDERGGP